MRSFSLLFTLYTFSSIVISLEYRLSGIDFGEIAEATFPGKVRMIYVPV